MTIDYATARTNMVDCQIRPSDVTDFSVIEAMLEIPREWFLSEKQAPLAYIDEDLPLEASEGDYFRYLMKPASLARLLQLADIQPDAIILDVGCGTGYSTAILSRLCSSVVALEQDESLARQATEILASLEMNNAVVVSAPLIKGFFREGPFDVILIGGAVDFVPEELLLQLKEGGKLVTVEGRGTAGQATLYLRQGTNFSKRTYFGCTARLLAEFEKKTGFEF